MATLTSSLGVRIKSDKPEPLYLIHNKKGSGCVGNCAIFWKRDGHGYTTNITEAWILTKEKAARLCSSRPDEDFPVQFDIVINSMETHVHIDRLQVEVLTAT